MKNITKFSHIDSDHRVARIKETITVLPDDKYDYLFFRIHATETTQRIAIPKNGKCFKRFSLFSEGLHSGNIIELVVISIPDKTKENTYHLLFEFAIFNPFTKKYNDFLDEVLDDIVENYKVKCLNSIEVIKKKF